MWETYELRDSCFQMNYSACWPRMFFSHTVMRRRETSRGGKYTHTHTCRDRYAPLFRLCACPSRFLFLSFHPHAFLPSVFPRMPSSTRWCMTLSKRLCWLIRGRSVLGTSSRPTSPTFWKKVRHTWNLGSFNWHSFSKEAHSPARSPSPAGVFLPFCALHFFSF